MGIYVDTRYQSVTWPACIPEYDDTWKAIMKDKLDDSEHVFDAPSDDTALVPRF